MTKLIILLTIFVPAILLSQNVAINNDGSLPDQSALLDISSTTKGILIPRMTTMQRQLISPPVIGLTVFDIDTYTYWVYRGDINGGWREMLMDLDKHWNKVGTHIFSTNSSNVGIGTNTPASKLTINGIDPVIGMMNNGISTGIIKANGFDMKINTHLENVNGKIILGTKDNDHFFIDHLGRVSIGTPTSSSALTINGSTPRFQMQHQNVNKGYLQVGNEDVSLGTNASNLLGNLNFNTKDITRMVIEPNGDVGIGTTNPATKLEVSTTANGQVLKLNALNQTYMGIYENNDYRGYVGSFYGNNADVDIGSFTGAVHLVTGSTIDLTAKAGKIGIGTENPEQLLHVVGTGDAFMKITCGTSSQHEAGIDLERTFNALPNVGQWRIVNKSIPGKLVLQEHHDDLDMADDEYTFTTSAFLPNGLKGLGSANYRWHTVYAENGTINTSDARDKTNIQNINYGLADVMKLRPVSFNWKDKPQSGTKLGLIAQEVKEVIGEVVVQGNMGLVKDEDGNTQPASDKYGMFYSDLIPVLIKATQEQQKMIEDLKKEIIEMKKLMEQR